MTKLRLIIIAFILFGAVTPIVASLVFSDARTIVVPIPIERNVYSDGLYLSFNCEPREIESLTSNLMSQLVSKSSSGDSLRTIYETKDVAQSEDLDSQLRNFYKNVESFDNHCVIKSGDEFFALFDLRMATGSTQKAIINFRVNSEDVKIVFGTSGKIDYVAKLIRFWWSQVKLDGPRELSALELALKVLMGDVNFQVQLNDSTRGALFYKWENAGQDTFYNRFFDKSVQLARSGSLKDYLHLFSNKSGSYMERKLQRLNEQLLDEYFNAVSTRELKGIINFGSLAVLVTSTSSEQYVYEYVRKYMDGGEFIGVSATPYIEELIRKNERSFLKSSENSDLSTKLSLIKSAIVSG